MKQFIIERDLPGVGALSADELRAISQKSCAVLAELGSEVQWQHSYVTADRIYCVYLAASEELVREHARLRRVPGQHGEQGHQSDHRPDHAGGLDPTCVTRLGVETRREE